MPKLEAKQIQRELETGKVRPVYWLYGPEKMKVRELIRRIRRAMGLDEKSEKTWSLEILDAADVETAQVLDTCQNLSLDAKTKLVQVNHAELLKDVEVLT